MYKDQDWDRAIRHGVRWDGSPLFLMPSHEFSRMSDEEFGRLLACVKSVPPVNRTPVARAIHPVIRVVHTFGAPLVPAEKIHHSTQPGAPPSWPAGRRCSAASVRSVA